MSGSISQCTRLVSVSILIGAGNRRRRTGNVSIVEKDNAGARRQYAVQTAQKFGCQLLIRKGERSVDGTSMLELLTLAAEHGTLLVLETRGPRAQDALARFKFYDVLPRDHIFHSVDEAVRTLARAP